MKELNSNIEGNYTIPNYNRITSRPNFENYNEKTFYLDYC